jgi:hypothetical protein
VKGQEPTRLVGGLSSRAPARLGAELFHTAGRSPDIHDKTSLLGASAVFANRLI